MILILSIEQDESTIDIIRWLYYLKEDFILLNNNEFINNVTVNINTSEVFITTKDVTVNFNEVTSVWYRRGNFMLYDCIEMKDFIGDKITEFYNEEKKDLFEYLHFLLSQKPSINNYNFKKVNKLIVLTIAKQLGLCIPKTTITNQKSVLEEELKDKLLITKPINDPISLYGDTYWFPTYTTSITAEKASLFDDSFGISLFQENIKKTLEIRSYFLDGEFYSMAIFSQLDEQTKTDFRCYNNQKPNRTIPFNLPLDIETKLKTLAEKLNLASCSFDLIYTPCKQYVFLEVNPIGQFGMVSYPCNYYLEEKIAHKLKKYDTSKRSSAVIR
ncbi:ATP-GRASP peptide maturase of grasp-with-spasm system [Tenacibaculum gallaicum]|uniref:ATP-GRASP peptide maturase of grasp-with-spasm system n=1 Tax=Tenacibaculum gallaicum TaxID=561505 RepID=A0A3E0ID86_9FLAO|nr:grasp-with-spasm system ATP-grasp peptide maturase [Tenacibaculum gallaicum]REH56137.1 ATP-GRASP peptide maturase of grasp-with-spasm system [Tenacibaculum gallaicum]